MSLKRWTSLLSTNRFWKWSWIKGHNGFKTPLRIQTLWKTVRYCRFVFRLASCWYHLLYSFILLDRWQNFESCAALVGRSLECSILVLVYRSLPFAHVFSTGAYCGLVEPANSLHFGFDVVWLRNVSGEKSTIHLDLYLQKGKANISCNFLLTFSTSSPNVGICLTSLRLLQGRTLRSSCSGWCCQSSSCSKKCEWHLAQPARQLGWWVMQPLQYESVWTNIKYIQIHSNRIAACQNGTISCFYWDLSQSRTSEGFLYSSAGGPAETNHQRRECSLVRMWLDSSPHVPAEPPIKGQERCSNL